MTPTTWITWFLPEPWALAAAAALRLWLAAAGAFLWIRKRKVSDPAAAAAGLAYAFSLAFTAWLHYPITYPQALLPWLALAVEHVAEGRAGGVTRVAIAVAALALGGYPEGEFLAGAAAPVRLRGGSDPGEESTRRAAGLAGLRRRPRLRIDRGRLAAPGPRGSRERAIRPRGARVAARRRAVFRRAPASSSALSRHAALLGRPRVSRESARRRQVRPLLRSPVGPADTPACSSSPSRSPPSPGAARPPRSSSRGSRFRCWSST